VYKQLFDKERKHWLDEKEKASAGLDQMQATCHKQNKQLKSVNEDNERLKEELEDRNQCEAKVQEYVQTLISQNNEL